MTPSSVKLTVLFWSTFSGLVIGTLAGVALGALGYVLLELLPSRWDLPRVRVGMMILCLVLLPLGGAVLGYLEGRLKLS